MVPLQGYIALQQCNDIGLLVPFQIVKGMVLTTIAAIGRETATISVKDTHHHTKHMFITRELPLYSKVNETWAISQLAKVK